MKNEDGMLPKRATTLMIRHQGADCKWHRNPAARGANGRVRPGHALVKGKVVPVSDGAYEIRYYEDRRGKNTSAGKNAADAETRVPADAIACPGNCESCGMCYELERLGHDVVFHIDSAIRPTRKDTAGGVHVGLFSFTPKGAW